MKTNITLIFIIYFLFFAGTGFVFYTKYLDNFTSKTEPLALETLNSPSAIYYSKGTTLYLLDPNRQANPLEVNPGEQFSLTGEISQLALSKNLLAAIEIKNTDGFSEIWQGTTSDPQKEKLASVGSAEFAGFEDFLKPQFSPDNTFLSFLGSGKTADVIFVKNLATNDLVRLGEDKTAKITDYSWNKDSSKVIFCTKSLLKNGCFEESLDSPKSTASFKEEVKEISWDKTEEIFYLTQADVPHLFRLDASGKNPQQLDNLISPNKIVSFQIDPAGQKIAYEIISDTPVAGGSDIYLAQTDGSNRLQISTDGNAQKPLFSPDGTEITFLRQKDGIYFIKTDKTNERKMINLSDTIDHLFLWR